MMVIIKKLTFQAPPKKGQCELSAAVAIRATDFASWRQVCSSAGDGNGCGLRSEQQCTRQCPLVERCDLSFR
jgi:hypothetical protein